MDYAINAISLVQFFFAIVIGLYFWNLLRSQQGNRVAVERESKKELDKLQKMREISLTEPLSEKTRPSLLTEVIGQEDGVKALRAALCGPNPQHVIIYGPPGVGKTAAARLILEEARRNPLSPFGAIAKFIEMDATTARFDERGIADPLIGTVHDPIYQGAGPLGMAGIPQPKAGAVTKAHGGMLFIDEIGELHHVQMNKLLKVLEDRKVFLESSYYSSEDTNIPSHIHDIFQNGLPADFRLVGATTRTPEDIPPAIRSRCMEVFFRALLPSEIALIADNSANKLNMKLENPALEVVKRYATNGRDAVNIVQIAGSLALERGDTITVEDVEWVINCGQYAPRPERQIPAEPQIGVVNGLAVFGPNMGALLEIEVTATPVSGPGQLTITGVIEEEETGGVGRTMRRKSMARSSVENVMTLLRGQMGVDVSKFDIHVNFPGGAPIDGPSAGITMATAIYSAITKTPIDNRIAMTGEVSIRGFVKAVGGVTTKISAAKQAGANKVIIPRDNWQESYRHIDGLEVLPVDRIQEVVDIALMKPEQTKLEIIPASTASAMIAAGGFSMFNSRQAPQ